MAIKSTSSGSVTVLDPILKQGNESAAAWNNIINQLLPTLKKRIFALVCDGIRGIEAIAENNNWVSNVATFIY